MQDPVITGDIAAHRDAFLALEREITRDYYGFIFDVPELAERWQTALFGGTCEFGAPWARVMLVDGRFGGMFAALPGAELHPVRLASGVRMLRGGPPLDAATRDRIRLAGRVSMAPAADELYLSRIGVVGALRGLGLGAWLLEQVFARGRELGTRRCVLEVDAGNAAAIAMYRRGGLAELERRSVADPPSARSYDRLWMGRDL